jgi:hypothetical protein
MAERMKIKSDVLVNMQKGMTQRNATKLLPYMYIYTHPPLLSLSLSVSLTWALFLTLSLTHTLTLTHLTIAPPPPRGGARGGGAPLSDRVPAGTEATPLCCYTVRLPEPRPHIC